MNHTMHEPRRSSGAGRLVFVSLVLLVCAMGYLGYTFFGSSSSSSTPNAPTPADPAAPSGGTERAAAAPDRPTPPASDVTINIAYGTEKKLWLTWAAEEFARAPEGRGITVNLIGRGSVEGARDVIRGPGDTPIHVWSPASSAYRDVFETEWEIQHGTSKPILRAENLVLSPMVFVMWKERYDAYHERYGDPTFETLTTAMLADGGWSSIAQQPDWGFFKFSHTDPNRSNSGLLTLVLMAYDFHQKERSLTLGDITDPDFQAWLRKFERATARPSGELTHSTGTLMREMVLRGPSQYDALMLYENLTIDYLRAAQGRWGELHVVYPQRTMWNENPYYVLDVPWSTPEQRAAASTFLDFLMSEPIQRRALDHGFRPGNPLVPIRTADSPFVQFEDHGIQIDITTVCEPPRAEVLNNLLSSFQRIDR